MKKSHYVLSMVIATLLVISLFSVAAGAIVDLDTSQPSIEEELGIDQNEMDSESLEKVGSEEYEEISPIRIDDDDDLEDAADEHNWPGDGSEEDPYIIENYELDGDGYGYGIFMGNVTDHFIIRENYIHSARGDDEPYYENSGIYIYNTTNGEIRDNDPITNNDFGIRMVNSQENLVINNNVSENEGEGWNDGHGIYIENSDSNSFENNTISESEDIGMLVEASDYNDFLNNEVSYNGEFGIILRDTIGNEFEDNEMIDDGIWFEGDEMENWDSHTIDESNTVNEDPIYYWVEESDDTVPDDAGQIILVNSTGVTIEDQHISETDVGITLAYSNENTITDNTVLDNFWHGIHLEESHRNDLVDNTVEENEHGIFFLYSSENTIIDNEVHYNDWHGISLRDFSMSNTISENNATNNGVVQTAANAIYLRDDSNENLVTNNTLSENPRGIFIRETSDNHIENNTVTDNEDSGIRLFIENENNKVINNYLENSGERHGIGVHRSDSNEIIDNTILDHEEYAIEIEGDSEDLYISGNEMVQGGLGLSGTILEGYNTHEIHENNTVNGDPVYYWRDQDGGEIPSDAGQVILSNSTDVTVDGLEVSNASMGINLGFSEDITITNNIANDGDFGIRMQESHNNFIKNNELSRNIFSGLYVYDSDYNEIVSNTVSDTIDLYGIYLFNSDESVLYHNNIVDNEFQAYSFGSETSEWDNGYPDGGNYWSDYDGVDLYHGEDRDQPGSDGIGDTEHDGDFVTDEYPLMEPAETPHVRIDHPNDHPEEDQYITDEEVTIELSGMYRYTDTLYYEIRLNEGDWIDLGTDSSYTFDDLEDGEYGLEVRVSDGEGNTDYNSAEFVLDTETPVLDITSPEEGTIISVDTFTVAWSAYDNTSGLDYSEVRLNDGEWTQVGRATAHTFTELEDEENMIEVRTWDQAGHNSTDELMVEVMTEPSLDIIAFENDVETDEAMISGEAEEGVNVWIDDEEVELDEEFSFEETVMLEGGENYIEIVAEDEAGNQNTKEITAAYIPQIDELRGEIDDLREDLEGQIDELRGDLEVQIDDLRDDLEDVEEDLQGQIDDLEGEIADIEGQIDALSNDLEDVEEDLQGQIDDLEVDIDDIEADITEIEDDIDGIENDIAALEDDIDEVWTELEGFQEEQEEIDEDQDDDIDMARNLGIVGIVLAILALVIAIVAMMKNKDESESISAEQDEEDIL